MPTTKNKVVPAWVPFYVEKFGYTKITELLSEGVLNRTTRASVHRRISEKYKDYFSPAELAKLDEVRKELINEHHEVIRKLRNG